MQYGNFDINLLRTLDALFTERSVTRAAVQLCISQPAMSGALHRLRDYFNDQLLVRSGHEMVLTPVGESLAGPVRASLVQIEATLSARPSFDPRGSARSFNLAMSDYGAFVVMPHLLRSLAVEAPRIACHIEPITAGTLDRMEVGDLDVLISVMSCEESLRAGAAGDIKMRRLDTDDFVCVVDEHHPSIRGELTLQQYREAQHLLVRFGSNLDTLVEKAWKRAGLDLSVVATAPSFFSMLFMLPGTSIVATVQRRFALALAPALQLRILECPVAIGGMQQILMWHARNDFDPGHHYLRQLIIEASRASAVDGDKDAAPVRRVSGDGARPVLVGG